jgi:hypothetical protein
MAELVPFECSACGPRVEAVASAEVHCSCGRRCRPALTLSSAELTVSNASGRVCGYCGADLGDRRPNVRYCSPSHRVLAHRKRKEVA